MARTSYPINCDGKKAFTDPQYSCRPGYTEVQRPEEPPEEVDAYTADKESISVYYYWKEVISLPSACGQTTSIAASTQVEKSVELSQSLETKLGTTTIQFGLKTTNTLEFSLPFGESDYIYQAALFQMHAYVISTKWSSIGWWILWKMGLEVSLTDCENIDLALNKFQLHTCRKFCGRGSSDTSNSVPND